MKKRMVAVLALCMVLQMTASAFACTAIVVGKGASEDGSWIMGRTEDIGGAYNKTFLVNPKWDAGEEVAFEDPYNGFKIRLPAESCKWSMVNDVPEHDDGQYAEATMNEFGVSLSATVSTSYNESAEAADPLMENGIREAYIPFVVIPYVTTAREAVERLGAIVEELGSAECSIVLMADHQEIWYMEIVSGHQWAAAKVPDNAYAVIPNCMLLGFVDVNDKDNYLCSETLFSMPQEKGFLATHDGLPHVALTYGSELADGNRVRAWGGRHFFSPSQQVPYDSGLFELFMEPDEPISLQDCMALMGYRYEGTEHDANLDLKKRAIGTERTAEAHLFWYRDHKPLVQWLCMGNPEFGFFLPVYESISGTPAAFQVEGEEYSQDSAYWTFRTLAGLAQLDRVNYGAPLKEYLKAYNEMLLAGIPEWDGAIAGMDAGSAAEYAGSLFDELSSMAMEKAKQISTELLVSVLSRGNIAAELRRPFEIKTSLPD